MQYKDSDALLCKKRCFLMRHLSNGEGNALWDSGRKPQRQTNQWCIVDVIKKTHSVQMWQCWAAAQSHRESDCTTFFLPHWHPHVPMRVPRVPQSPAQSLQGAYCLPERPALPETVTSKEVSQTPCQQHQLWHSRNHCTPTPWQRQSREMGGAAPLAGGPMQDLMI